MVPGAGIEPARCCHRGIFLPTTVFTARSLKNALWSGLSLYHIMMRAHDLGRSRQVSTLSQQYQHLAILPGSLIERLSSGLPPSWHVEVSPNLTPFTPGVSNLGAQFFKSLASTNFATWAYSEWALLLYPIFVIVVLRTTVYHNATRARWRRCVF